MGTGTAALMGKWSETGLLKEQKTSHKPKMRRRMEKTKIRAEIMKYIFLKGKEIINETKT